MFILFVEKKTLTYSGKITIFFGQICNFSYDFKQTFNILCFRGLNVVDFYVFVAGN